MTNRPHLFRIQYFENDEELRMHNGPTYPHVAGASGGNNDNAEKQSVNA